MAIPSPRRHDVAGHTGDAWTLLQNLQKCAPGEMCHCSNGFPVRSVWRESRSAKFCDNLNFSPTTADSRCEINSPCQLRPARVRAANMSFGTARSPKTGGITSGCLPHAGAPRPSPHDRPLPEPWIQCCGPCAQDSGAHDCWPRMRGPVAGHQCHLRGLPPPQRSMREPGGTFPVQHMWIRSQPLLSATAAAPVFPTQAWPCRFATHPCCGQRMQASPMEVGQGKVFPLPTRRVAPLPGEPAQSSGTSSGQLGALPLRRQLAAAHLRASSLGVSLLPSL